MNRFRLSLLLSATLVLLSFGENGFAQTSALIEVNGDISYVEVLVAAPEQQAAVVENIQPSLETLSTQPGFVSSVLHQSTDSDYVVAYTQFEDSTTLQTALDNPAYQEQTLAYQDLITSRTTGKYQVASLDSPANLTQLELKTEHDYTVIIDLIHANPEEYETLSAQTIAHAKGFVAMPGFQAAAVLPVLGGEEKTTLVTYAHWASVEDFLGTISKMTGHTLTTMKELNETLAGLGAKTEYQQYQVVLVLLPKAQE
ncbi:MAG: antibiotic biosynthesis monooxygenase [Trueperaceae bacterium]